MGNRINDFRQPIGPAMDNWQGCPQPVPVTLQGRYCQLEPLSAARHTSDLFRAFHSSESSEAIWTYLFAGPFADEAQFAGFIIQAEASRDPLHFAVIDNTGRAIGTLSLMRTDAANGSTEVGHVMFSPTLQQTPLSTEAQFLLMKHVFEDLGYRRYEWKCDSLNAPSRKAALRLGFQFEGLFRQVLIYKGRSRDTAWFSVVDNEWPALSAAFTQWLDSTNFDDQGRQKASLQTFMPPEISR